jgi:hypothetical protein
VSPRTLISAFLAFVCLLLGAAAPAHANDTPFAQRYAQTMRGSIEATGNQLLTCPAAAAGCTNARARTGSLTTMNNNYNMGYVDVDSDASTVNSSSATLTLPAGATVAWAGLYWGADTSAGTGGSAAPNAANRGTVKLKVGSGAYQSVTANAADILTSTGTATRYRAFANVTGSVTGNNTYTVADVQTGRGDDRWAGWTLVVAYQDATQAVHRVSVYDGLGTVDATHTFSTNIAPFYTPASGPVVTKTGLLAFEGDAGLQTEVATFNGTALTDSLVNTLNNLENSSMTVDGVYIPGRNPSYNNTQGTDIDVFNNTGLLSNHQSSATLAFSSTQDLFVPSALWLVSDEGPASNTSGPSIGGIARDGSTLTANPGSWDGTPTITYGYQWQRCDAAGDNCVDIPGATGSTYTLGPDDVGSTIRVVVTAVNDAGSSNPATSAATGTISQLAPSNITLPAVSGAAQDDGTLTTTLGGWNGTAPLDYDVQWQRCDASGNNCADIAGATAWSYVLTGADIGSTIRSEVTASNAAGSATAHSAPSGTVAAVAPANTVAPAVSGAARDGQTLSAGTGTWTGTDPIAYTYQWQRCDAGGGNCADIAGETGSSYDLAAADIGHSVRVQVTGTNVAGNATASSSPTSAVVADPPANTVAPALSGTAQDGSTLTLDDGSWSGTGPLAFDVVWQRCHAAGANCAAIAGETGTSYTLTAADIDATIRALVTASNVAGVATAQTAPTTVVAPEPPVNTVAPVVSGTRVDGGTLTTGDGTWSGTQPILFTYQWQRCDGLVCTDITGATSDSYTLGAGDIGHDVRAVVTAANDAGAASASSAVAVPVAPAPPVSVVAPTTTGTPLAGQTLTAHDGTWDGSQPMTPAYQWQRCDADGTNCADIAGATDDTYTLADDDAGHTVRVEVTYTNAAGSDTGHSAPSGVVDGNPPANTTDPSISGTARDGQVLTLDDGAWSGTPALVPAYQWQRCDATGSGCADIAGETGLSYTLQGADVGHTVRAVVTVTNAWGSASEAADPSAVVLAAPPAVTIDPSVTGTAVDGQTVSADPGVWAGTGPVDFTYQWLRCDLDGTNCVDIAGATGSSYVLTGADADRGIRVEVTGTNAAGSATGTSPVAAVDALAPQNTTAPSISGTQMDGHTLTADPGEWSGTTPLHFDYAWLRCDADGTNCVAIPGATDDTYELTGADVGHQILVSVQASNSAGSAQATSVPAAHAVDAAPPHAVTAPAVTGGAQDGGTLSAGTGSFTGTDPIAYTYQWQRCDADGSHCADIAGATSDTYTLGSDDIGHGVRVVVTGTNVAGEDSASSAPTAAVTAAPPVSTTAPGIAGVTVDGQTLTADHGGFSGTGPFDYTYQWQRCDADGTHCVDLPGATGDTYDLVSSDVGGAVRVIVTATNGAGSDSATSPATTEVLALAPANVTPPSISGGTPLDGHTLTADPGTWSGTQPMGFGYQWQRCDADGTDCTDILGATGDAYTLAPGDIDHVITVVVTASNSAGSAQSGSAQTAPAEAAPPVNTVVPVVSGTLEDGSTLSATTGSFTGTDPIAYAYQWQRCDADGTHCADIAGATGSTYDLTGADVGHAIVVEVTATNAAGEDTATSVAGASVAVDPPATSGTPDATGTPVDGQTLTADPGAWTGTGPIEFTYQWQRCDAAGANCADIAGATDETYTLGSDDVGSTVRVIVTGDNGEQTSVASDPVGPIDPAPPVSVVAPAISGTAGAGHTLTAGDGTWGGTHPLDFTYQWQRCDADGSNCTDIAGATDSTYDLTGGDVGHAIRVEVTATNAAGDDTAVSAPTAATLPAPPVNTTQPPAPGGTGIDGGTLTADPGAWTGDAPVDYTYQWQRCDADGTNCTDIAGATDGTYTPGPADVGHAIVVVVTATNPGGSTSQASEPSTPVAAAPPANATPPSVSGDPSDGGTLTVDPGTWTGTPPDLTYQWQRCDADGSNCVSIAGETGSSYILGSDDVGHAVTVVVTASNPAGDATSTAPATPAVAATPPHDTVAPVVDGAVAPGATLSAGDGAWSGTTPVDFTYQWQRCDADGSNCVDIAGATDDTYTLGDDDLGHTVVVVVTATNAAGTDTATSAPSAVLPAPPHNTTPPSISGTEEPGSVLTADPGTWSGTGPFDMTYQWQRCDFFGNNCVDIAGATGDSYTLAADDVGHTIKVVVSASNAAGSDSAGAPASAAVTDPAPDPDPDPTPTPTPTPSPTPTPTPTKPKPATPAPSGNHTPSGPVSTASAFGGLGGADLGSVPGSLVSDASCQQLLGNSKYRRVEAKGIGTVRLRAYAKGPATKNSPVRVTTQITRGKAKKVTYKLDGRRLKGKRKGFHNAVITPQRLARIGTHTLVATVQGKKKKAKKVVSLTLKTVTCRTLFTAQRWRTFSGAGLRLRIDSRSAMQGIAFKVPGVLLPRQAKQKRVIGFMRVFVAGEAKRRRFSLKLAPKGKKTPLVRGAGKPTVTMGKGAITVAGLPERAAVAEVTLYRLKKLDGAPKRRAFKVRARVAPSGASFSVRTKPLR